MTKTDWVVSKTLHVIICFFYVFQNVKNVTFYVFFALLHTFSRTMAIQPILPLNDIIGLQGADSQKFISQT